MGGASVMRWIGDSAGTLCWSGGGTGVKCSTLCVAGGTNGFNWMSSHGNLYSCGGAVKVRVAGSTWVDCRHWKTLEMNLARRSGGRSFNVVANSSITS